MTFVIFLFFRLSQDLYQTAKVSKVLMLLDQGRGNEFKGKSLNDIQLADKEAEEDGDMLLQTENDQPNIECDVNNPENSDDPDNEFDEEDDNLLLQNKNDKLDDKCSVYDPENCDDNNESDEEDNEIFEKTRKRRKTFGERNPKKKSNELSFTSINTY